MKTVYINIRLATLAAAAMIPVFSCTKTQRVGSGDADREICFTPVTACSSTKDIILGNEFPSDGMFDASFVFLPNKDSEGHVTFEGAQNIFTLLTLSNQGGVWKSADGIRYFWPVAGGGMFVANYPCNTVLLEHKLYNGFSFDPTTYTGIYRNYEIKHTDAEYNPITDDALKNDTNLPNAAVDYMTCFVTYDNVEERDSDVVPILFSHNLTLLRFEIKAADDYSQFELLTGAGAPATEADWDHANVAHVGIKLLGLELQNIWSVGDYHASAPHWPEVNDAIHDLYDYKIMTCDDSNGVSLAYQNGSGEIGDSYDDVLEFGTRTPYPVEAMRSDSQPARVLMIPQRLHSTAALKITYSISQKSDRMYNNGSLVEGDPGYRSDYNMTDYSTTVTRTVALPSIFPVWSTGTCYKYTISVGLNAIEVSGTYEDWKNGTVEPAVI